MVKGISDPSLLLSLVHFFWQSTVGLGRYISERLLDELPRMPDPHPGGLFINVDRTRSRRSFLLHIHVKTTVLQAIECAAPYCLNKLQYTASVRLFNHCFSNFGAQVSSIETALQVLPFRAVEPGTLRLAHLTALFKLISSLCKKAFDCP